MKKIKDLTPEELEKRKKTNKKIIIGFIIALILIFLLVMFTGNTNTTPNNNTNTKAIITEKNITLPAQTNVNESIEYNYTQYGLNDKNLNDGYMSQINLNGKTYLLPENTTSGLYNYSQNYHNIYNEYMIAIKTKDFSNVEETTDGILIDKTITFEYETINGKNIVTNIYDENGTKLNGSTIKSNQTEISILSGDYYTE